MYVYRYQPVPAHMCTMYMYPATRMYTVVRTNRIV